MKTTQGLDVCSNVPIAGDTTDKLIVAHAVTKAVTALDPLATLAKRAQDTLAMEQLEAVADMGDYHGHEGKKGREEGMVPYIPKPTTSANST